MRALLLTLVLTGCASTTQITTRTVTDTPPATGEAILLAAQSPEGEVRETWELTCRPVFARAGLTVHLAHQETPLWRDRDALTRWAGQHGVDRVLLVDLTRLMMSAPNLPAGRDLNPLGQDTEVQPTWRLGLDGERIDRERPADTEQRFPAYLTDGAGKSLWYGEARTHEANDQAAIAQSQCRALRDALRQHGVL
ncbi:hypothetical protein ACLD02_09490 [Alloalcanivorax sp. C16-2]|uniref:hypothetical protein n=1 Tax=Alloalcanivorax TaxID=3020832 RepID=UPI0019317192|nr:hypothetical protein [Alloalcanivorax marinus]MBL7249602.1 hypothetical protein [Alloalcanivorax marinus]